jgi:hypothetical protein
VYAALTLIALALSCWFIVRRLKLTGPVERILATFVLAAAQIVIWGHVLSLSRSLSVVRAWSSVSLATALVAFLVMVLDRDRRPRLAPPTGASLARFMRSVTTVPTRMSRFEWVFLTPLLFTVCLLGVVDVLVIVYSAPHNWDSMTYHLARVAYFLQQGHTAHFDANFWAQVVHPTNSALLLLFTYLISGRNENLTQSVQFVSYWVAVLTVYGISRKAGHSKTQSTFAASVAALLTEWLMQATTTQNDMLMAACLGVATYFLFAFRDTHDRKYLGLAAAGIGLAIGTKASSLLSLPSVALVAAYVFARSTTPRRRRISDPAIFVGGVLAAVCLFALPAGYIENYRHFGHPIGPDDVRARHSFESASLGYVARNGTRNLVRYGFDFLSLDGLPSQLAVVRAAQRTLRFLPERIVGRLGLTLETAEATRAAFKPQKTPSAHEDRSYWGVFGFGLAWVMALLSMAGLTKSPDLRVLSLAGVLFVLAQAYSGPYDPWRGRYFIACAVFVVPAVGACVRADNRFTRLYVLLVVFVGCVSAVSAVVRRDNSTLISLRERTLFLFTMDRMHQLTRNRPDYYEPLEAFDRLVPSHATVAVALERNSFEYPLFGERLTRTIVPINAFDKGLQPVPSHAEYLLYARNTFPCPATDDRNLGADWYLRRLTDTNRRCP